MSRVDKTISAVPSSITIKLNKHFSKKKILRLRIEWHNFSLELPFNSPELRSLSLPTLKMAKAINLFNLSFSRHYLSALCSLPSIFISNNTHSLLPFWRILWCWTQNSSSDTRLKTISIKLIWLWAAPVKFGFSSDLLRYFSLPPSLRDLKNGDGNGRCFFARVEDTKHLKA